MDCQVVLLTLNDCADSFGTGFNTTEESMSISHNERVGQAMQLFLEGTRPFVERELKDAYGDRWEEIAQNCLRANRDPSRVQNEPLRWDAYLVMIIVSEQWHQV